MITEDIFAALLPFFRPVADHSEIKRVLEAALAAQSGGAVAVKPEPRPQFPILGGGGAKFDLRLVLDHREQAVLNHGQSVTRLAERGGLAWTELYAVLHDKSWKAMDTNEAMLACRALEARYLAALLSETTGPTTSDPSTAGKQHGQGEPCPANSPAPEGWPTHRHIKRGSEYTLVGIGKMQSDHWVDGATIKPVSAGGQLTIAASQIDMREVAIYRGKDGDLWVRPREEFDDGRFVSLPTAPAPETPAMEGDHG